MEEAEKKSGPGRIMYGIGILLSIIGCAISVALLYKGVNELPGKFVQLEIPGTHEVVFSKPGEYSVYYEYKSVKDNKRYDTSQNLPNVDCSLTGKKDGRRISLNPVSLAVLYKIGTRIGIQIYKFKITRPGEYLFSVNAPGTGPNYKVIFAIGGDYAETFWGIIKLPAVLFAITQICALVSFLAVYIKRRKKKEGIRLAKENKARKEWVEYFMLIAGAAILLWLILYYRPSPPRPAGQVRMIEQIMNKSFNNRREAGQAITADTAVQTGSSPETDASEESLGYAEDVFSEAFAAWDIEALKENITKKLADSFEEGELESMFDDYAVKYGYLNEMSRISGGMNRGSEFSAEYKVEAKYYKENATIDLSIVKTEDGWRVKRFSVE